MNRQQMDAEMAQRIRTAVFELRHFRVGDLSHDAPPLTDKARFDLSITVERIEEILRTDQEAKEGKRAA